MRAVGFVARLRSTGVLLPPPRRKASSPASSLRETEMPHHQNSGGAVPPKLLDVRPDAVPPEIEDAPTPTNFRAELADAKFTGAGDKENVEAMYTRFYLSNGVGARFAAKLSEARRAAWKRKRHVSFVALSFGLTLLVLGTPLFFLSRASREAWGPPALYLPIMLVASQALLLSVLATDKLTIRILNLSLMAVAVVVLVFAESEVVRRAGECGRYGRANDCIFSAVTACCTLACVRHPAQTSTHATSTPRASKPPRGLYPPAPTPPHHPSSHLRWLSSSRRCGLRCDHRCIPAVRFTAYGNQCK